MKSSVALLLCGLVLASTATANILFNDPPPKTYLEQIRERFVGSDDGLVSPLAEAAQEYARLFVEEFQTKAVPAGERARELAAQLSKEMQEQAVPLLKSTQEIVEEYGRWLTKMTHEQLAIIAQEAQPALEQARDFADTKGQEAAAYAQSIMEKMAPTVEKAKVLAEEYARSLAQRAQEQIAELMALENPEEALQRAREMAEAKLSEARDFTQRLAEKAAPEMERAREFAVAKAQEARAFASELMERAVAAAQGEEASRVRDEVMKVAAGISQETSRLLKQLGEMEQSLVA
ncbi:unnamed protein product [Lampetra planeri]